MKIRTLHTYSVTELQTQLEVYQTENFHPTLALIFSSQAIQLDAIGQMLIAANIDYWGCSTAGEIIDNEVTEQATVGLLLEIDKAAYSIDFQENTSDKIFTTAQQIGTAAKAAFKHPALLLASGGITSDGEQIVYGLKSILGENVPIFGGLAGDDLQGLETYAFCHKGNTKNGLCALIFDNERIKIEGMAISGWEPVGTPNIVTRAEGNIVYSINNEPALDVFIKYFGYFDNAQIEGRAISSISAQYPLQFDREDGSVVLRSPLVGSEEDRTLVLAGGVKEGDTFRFSISPGFDVIDQTVEEFGTFKTETEEADALILFSCKGRHAALGPMIEDEIAGIYDYWKAPMIGFFSYGEIGNTRGNSCDFHNETCSLVLLKEIGK